MDITYNLEEKLVLPTQNRLLSRNTSVVEDPNMSQSQAYIIHPDASETVAEPNNNLHQGTFYPIQEEAVRSVNKQGPWDKPKVSEEIEEQIIEPNQAPEGMQKVLPLRQKSEDPDAAEGYATADENFSGDFQDALEEITDMRKHGMQGALPVTQHEGNPERNDRLEYVDDDVDVHEGTIVPRKENMQNAAPLRRTERRPNQNESYEISDIKDILYQEGPQTQYAVAPTEVIDSQTVLLEQGVVAPAHQSAPQQVELVQVGSESGDLQEVADRLHEVGHAEPRSAVEEVKLTHRY